MRRNISYKKIPAVLIALVLALALSCQTAAAGRALVPGGYTVGIKWNLWKYQAQGQRHA